MTTALVTTCDRCGKTLDSKPAPAPKSATISAVAFTSSISPVQPKQYDFCGQCYVAFGRWLQVAESA